LPDEVHASSLLIYDLEGEAFFGAWLALRTRYPLRQRAVLCTISAIETERVVFNVLL
jgi:hypothetical protein